MKLLIRCGWCEKDDIYKAYHDTEWGRPIFDDAKIFEFLLLESFQAGLSWYTILTKREHFKKAFDDFDYSIIANYDSNKIAELLNNTGIIRNKLKILASITNARAFIKVQLEYGTFSNYLWSFVNKQPIDNLPKTLKDVPATTKLSDRIASELKKKGFKFMGSTVVYAFMQAIGMVNDHIIDCSFRN